MAPPTLGVTGVCQEADSTKTIPGSYESDDDYYGLYDSVCSLCDDGGDVLFCHGPCFRCFHPTAKTGLDSRCQSLGFRDAAEFHEIETFICNNCKHQNHQCFLCGMLGSSDVSSPAEVFRCVSACCGYYYHPDCVANKLYPDDKKMAAQVSNQIATGEPFTCPLHRCHRCGGVENKSDYAMPFAVCRRCPKSYHRQCLPRKIGFTSTPDGSIQQRAWDNLLPNRILMYCMKHELVPGLHTPARDHMLVPVIVSKKNEDTNATTMMMIEKRSKLFGNTKQPARRKRAAHANAVPTTRAVAHKASPSAVTSHCTSVAPPQPAKTEFSLT